MVFFDPRMCLILSGMRSNRIVCMDSVPVIRSLKKDLKNNMLTSEESRKLCS
jgi:hypothetical protein